MFRYTYQHYKKIKKMAKGDDKKGIKMNANDFRVLFDFTKNLLFWRIY